MYAEGQHALLVIIQGMDASGKDGAIRNVFGKLNPQGVEVKSFKVPTAEEAAHDFLWRVHQHAPSKGIIQIFNRSHYEDVLVTRVHKWIDDQTAKKRMEAINEFEKLLQEHNNTAILKFYLHVSQEEQLKRLNERIRTQGSNGSTTKTIFPNQDFGISTWQCMRIVLNTVIIYPGTSFPLIKTGTKSIQ